MSVLQSLAKSKLDFNVITPTDGKLTEPNSDRFDFSKDKLNSKEELLAKFHKMDPWMRSEFLKEVAPKINPHKSKLFELEIDDEEYECIPSRRQNTERGLNVKDLAALSSIIHSYAGEEKRVNIFSS